MRLRKGRVRRPGMLAMTCAGVLALGGLAAVPISTALAGATTAAPDAAASSGDASPTADGTCEVQPADPKAIPQARKLLCYLYRQYGNHMLAGQQESLWNGGPEYEMDYLYKNTGKYPAIRGLDLSDRPQSIDRAVAWWQAGGIPMLGWHVGAPTKTDDYTGSQESVSIDATLTEGTPEYVSHLERLDQAATQLLRAQAASVPILWRPYHEAGGTWFWWNKEGGAQYVRLWKFQFQYFTVTKGIHNLVWLHPYNSFPEASFYPGKAYVDLGGADNYANDHAPLTEIYNNAKKVYGGGLPIALHESGPIPDPAKAAEEGAKWVMFCTWNSEWLTEKNELSFLRAVYSSDYVVTRDEVPNLK